MSCCFDHCLAIFTLFLSSSFCVASKASHSWQPIPHQDINSSILNLLYIELKFSRDRQSFQQIIRLEVEVRFSKRVWKVERICNPEELKISNLASSEVPLVKNILKEAQVSI